MSTFSIATQVVPHMLWVPDFMELFALQHVCPEAAHLSGRNIALNIHCHLESAPPDQRQDALVWVRIRATGFRPPKEEWREIVSGFVWNEGLIRGMWMPLLHDLSVCPVLHVLICRLDENGQRLPFARADRAAATGLDAQRPDTE